MGPKYLQIANELRDQIMEGILQSGSAIPTERSLMKYYGVSRVTIRSALKELVQDSLLSSKQGSGYVVCPPISLPLSRITSFSEYCLDRGWAPGSIIISKREGYINKHENTHFCQSEDTRVVRVKRIRTGDDEPLLIEHATFLASDGFDWPWPNNSLYKAMRSKNRIPVRGKQSYKPVLATASQSKKLKLKAGSPLMLVTRQGYAADNVPVEYSQCWFNPDRWDFSHELHR